ncbi:mechanosensitive ion channel family protein [bacterium]|nr:mechanosensitive ion channel family protein [bacterium]
MNPTLTSGQLVQMLDLKSYTTPILDMVGQVVVELPAAIILFLIGVLTIRLLSKLLIRVLGLTKLPKGLIKVSVRLLDMALWILLSIAIFQLIGLTNVAFAVSGAFAVLALGFSQGISATINDTVSGLNLARDRHFRIGDKVMAGDHKTKGIIIDMDMRKSRIKDDKGYIHVIPNSLVDKNEFVLIERAALQAATVAPARKVIRRVAVRTKASSGTISGRKQ